MTGTGSEIAVIGSGVVGLSTAVELLRRGACVRVYSNNIDSPPASSVAPAMFTPYPGPSDERLLKWSEASFHRLSEIAETIPSAGVGIGTLREYFYSPSDMSPWLMKLLQLRKLPLRAPFAEIADTTRPHIDMLRYLPWLRSEVLRLGGSIIARAIRSIDELFVSGYRSVVNCAGIGAAAFTQDSLARSMHGQVVHVPNNIDLEHSLHDDAPGGRVTYIFRFQDRLVVGGTFEPGRVDTGTDDAAISSMLDRARELLRLDGIAKHAELGRRILQARAAERPARGRGETYEDIRVEAERRSNGRTLVHNYGHGRMGVTLAWGTAADAAELALRS